MPGQMGERSSVFPQEPKWVNKIWWLPIEILGAFHSIYSLNPGMEIPRGCQTVGNRPPFTGSGSSGTLKPPPEKLIVLFLPSFSNVFYQSRDTGICLKGSFCLCVYVRVSFREAGLQGVAMGKMAVRPGLVVVLGMTGAKPREVCANPWVGEKSKTMRQLDPNHNGS